jgi:site-specific DNA-methyltransferase (adenine-specific)
MLISKATQRRRTITERQSVAFYFGRSRKAGKPYAAEGAAEMEKIMDVKNIPIKEIVPYARNAKKHDKRQIDNVAESIRQYGFVQPVVIDRDGVIVIGHCRVLAAKKLGMEAVPCVCVDDLTPEQVNALRLVDNKTNESDWDMDLLSMELPEIDLSAFDFDWGLPEITEEVIEDEAPEVDEDAEPITKLGDIWKLGRHRLMCGDSTDKETVQALIDGASIDMVFTDPPYNVAFNGRSGKFDVIENDDLADDDFENFISAVCDVIKFIAPKHYYVWCNWKFYATLQTKLDFKSCIVWAKNVFGLGKGYRHQHEFCLFNGEIDDSVKNESDLWEIAKDTNYVHPTQKPVALIGRALKNHKGVKTVLDLFGGSGSSLIGCEQLDRTCYMMELDPKYCDVIIKRWEKFTGEKAVLLSDD